MKHLGMKSSNYCMTPQQQDTLVKMKPSPKFLTCTGGQGCAHGSWTTSRDARYASRTKISLTVCHHQGRSPAGACNDCYNDCYKELLRGGDVNLTASVERSFALGS